MASRCENVYDFASGELAVAHAWMFTTELANDHDGSENVPPLEVNEESFHVQAGIPFAVSHGMLPVGVNATSIWHRLCRSHTCKWRQGAFLSIVRKAIDAWRCLSYLV